MSIYSRLKDRLPEDTPSLNPCQATLILTENGDPTRNDPLLGITYQCDFRYEEEAGAGEMTDLFLRTASDSFLAQEKAKNADYSQSRHTFSRRPVIPGGTTQANLVYQDDQIVAFAAKTHFYDAEKEIRQAKTFIRENEASARGIPILPMALWRASRDELRAMAKERGMKGYSGLKRDTLMTAIHHHDYADLPETNVHPGWFHFGNLLVLPRPKDTFGAVLDLLVEAAQAGTLTVGGGGAGFGAGFSFFDERDLSDDGKADISRQNAGYREDMDALRPVAEVVQAKHGYIFLGQPRRTRNGPVYWLNGEPVTLPSGRRQQPSGWYSIQELLEEKYIADAEHTADRHDAREKEMS